MIYRDLPLDLGQVDKGQGRAGSRPADVRERYCAQNTRYTRYMLE